MDMDKCCVVVFSPEEDCPPDKMTPQAMHALVRARETHIRYKSFMGTAFVQLVVTFALSASSPKTLVLGVLGATLVNAAICGLVARLWRRRFEKLASE